MSLPLMPTTGLGVTRFNINAVNTDPGTRFNQAPGIFTFEVTTTSGYYNIHNSIPKQDLKLTGYRVEFQDDTTNGSLTTATANAVAAQSLLVDFPFISKQHVIDGRSDQFCMAVTLGDSYVTFVPACDETFHMSHDIHESFMFRITNGAGSSSIPGFKKCTLKFQFTQSLTG